jgi:hypothetical protein
MSLGSMRAQLAPFGDVSILCHALDSNWMNRHVSEHTTLGKLMWTGTLQAERRFASTIARLGNFVQIVLRKR